MRNFHAESNQLSERLYAVYNSACRSALSGRGETEKVSKGRYEFDKWSSYTYTNNKRNSHKNQYYDRGFHTKTFQQFNFRMNV